MKEDYYNLLNFMELYVTRNKYDRTIADLKRTKDIFQEQFNRAEFNYKMHPNDEHLQKEYKYWGDNVSRIHGEIRKNKKYIHAIKDDCRKRIKSFPARMQQKLENVLEETHVEYGIERISKLLKGFSY